MGGISGGSWRPGGATDQVLGTPSTGRTRSSRGGRPGVVTTGPDFRGGSRWDPEKGRLVNTSPAGSVGAGGTGVGGAGGAGGGGAGGGAGGGGNHVVNFNTQQPGYMKDIMGFWEQQMSRMGDLYDEPFDKDAEIADMRRMQSGREKEARDIASARGGDWNANIGERERSANEEVAATASGFTNRELKARQDMLESFNRGISGMSGTGGQMNQFTLGQEQNQLAMASLQQKIEEMMLNNQIRQEEMEQNWQRIDDEFAYNEANLL